ncbi:MAG TPA: hypothetical protein VM029_19305 [Opitutaceae bacterium]|nr:hypothetical protein [Opitutaceae bacterium]
MATPAQPKTPVELDRIVRSSAGWCFWIAGLTAVNAVLTVSGSDVSFLIGTMIAQGVMYLAKDSGAIAQFLAIAFNLGVIGFFVGMGFAARRGKRWPFVLAFVAYTLDSLVLLLDPHAMAIGFHAWALFSLYVGFISAGRLRKAIDAEAAAAQPFAPPVLATPAATAAPPTLAHA